MFIKNSIHVALDSASDNAIALAAPIRYYRGMRKAELFIRLEPEQRKILFSKAKRAKKSVAQIVREALEIHLARK